MKNGGINKSVAFIVLVSVISHSLACFFFFFSVFQKAQVRLKLQVVPSLQRLMIYRWAQQALATPADHPLLPLVWQKFFQLYLRQPGPEFGCVKQKHSVFIRLVIVFLVSGFLKWRFTNFLNISSCYFSSLKCRCYTMHVGFKVHGVRFIFKWKSSACSSFLLFFSPSPSFPFLYSFLNDDFTNFMFHQILLYL